MDKPTPDPLTAEDLAELDDIERQATPGPWLPGTHDGDLAAFLAESVAKRDNDRLHLVFVGDDPNDCLFVAVTGNGPASEANMDFICAARTVIPMLRATLDAQQARLDQQAARLAGLEKENKALHIAGLKLGSVALRAGLRVDDAVLAAEITDAVNDWWQVTNHPAALEGRDTTEAGE